ncbi:DUF3293 domain-containing protein [Elioraea rosea]|uniref:DUF3293 domain-containing protein n=1 Tax=Elioraea rosea TaxID=2492390 RepID=UPI0011834858|nr:DUF3293 domain-containing protein [Elioraea rosea]
MGGDAAAAEGGGLSRIPLRTVPAYRAARYAVWFRDETISLSVGTTVPRRVGAWLGAAMAAVFVTPCAPRGRPRRPGVERASFRRFRARVVAARIAHLEGEGGDHAGQWPSEPSLLVRLKHPSHAAGWGRALDQNAVLLVQRRGAVRLLLLR